MMTIGAQVKNNLVAIISLVAAISGFMFDTWRDHQNEEHQNMRNAAFEVLKELGELQTIVNYAHYDTDVALGNPIEGWKYAIQVRDLSCILNAQSAAQGNTLYQVWQQHWPTIRSSPLSEQHVSAQIAKTRAAVLHNIHTLK